MPPRSELVRRVLYGSMCCASGAFCGLAIGTWVGRRFLVPVAAGLEVARVALGSGLTGLAIGVVLALALGVLLPLRWLARVSTVSAVVAGMVLLLAGWVYLRTQSRQQRELAAAVARLPPYRFEIENFGATEGSPQVRVGYDSATDRFQVTNLDGTTCSSSIDGMQKISLMRALRRIELLLMQSPQPCPERLPTHRLAFAVADRTHAPEERHVFFTSACAGQHPELRTLVVAAQRTFLGLQSQQRCLR